MDARRWIERYSIDCRLKYNSIKTQKNYISQVTSFCYKFTSEFVEPKAIPTERIKLWILEKDSPNTRNHRLCAVKSFYQLTVGMPDKIDKIPFSKKDKKLPIVLSVDEVQKMFSVCENKKHLSMLAILYSAGLRAMEVINLKPKDIDSSRMVINIIQGKGKKDRQVMLDPDVLDLLRLYYKEYKPVNWLFNGEKTGSQYTKRSLLEVVKNTAIKAGITKKVWTHLMRHNCMTHLHESGVDIYTIKELCGHSSIKSTMLYTHLSHNHISKIRSPFADIKLKTA